MIRKPLNVRNPEENQQSFLTIKLTASRPKLIPATSSTSDPFLKRPPFHLRDSYWAHKYDIVCKETDSSSSNVPLKFSQALTKSNRKFWYFDIPGTHFRRNFWEGLKKRYQCGCIWSTAVYRCTTFKYFCFNVPCTYIWKTFWQSNLPRGCISFLSIITLSALSYHLT